MKKKLLGILVCMLFIASVVSGVENMSMFSVTEEKVTSGDLEKVKMTSLEVPLFEEWNRTFGGSLWDWGFSVQQTIDGGYIITGYTNSAPYTNSYDTGLTDVCLIKTDSNGNEIWNKTFGGNDEEWCNSVQQTSDGGYIIAGHTYSYGAGSSDVWLIKTDSSGSEIWNKTFGGSDYDAGNSVQQTSDGGYIISGSTKSYGAVDHDVWLIKTDDSGNMIWNQTFDESKDEWGSSVQQTTDGGYIICGTSLSYDTTDSYILLIKTNENGDGVWSKKFKGKIEDRHAYGTSVQQTNDGSYIVTGGFKASSWTSYDLGLLNIDTNGNIKWIKRFGGNKWDYGSSVQQTTDGGYIITGYTESFGAGASDVWLIKTDSSGNDIWDKTFGGNNHEWGESVQQTTDGGYIIAGYTASFNAKGRDVWLIKVAEPPQIQTEISGGLGISVVIKNFGETNLYDLRWSFESNGLILILNKHGTIASLPAGSETKIRKLAFGIGSGAIRITVGDLSKTASFFMIGPFVILQ